AGGSRRGDVAERGSSAPPRPPTGTVTRAARNSCANALPVPPWPRAPPCASLARDDQRGRQDKQQTERPSDRDCPASRGESAPDRPGRHHPRIAVRPDQQHHPTGAPIPPSTPTLAPPSTLTSAYPAVLLR